MTARSKASLSHALSPTALAGWCRQLLQGHAVGIRGTIRRARQRHGVGRCAPRLPGLGAAVVATPSIKAWRAGPTPLDRTDREETQLDDPKVQQAQRCWPPPPTRSTTWPTERASSGVGIRRECTWQRPHSGNAAILEPSKWYWRTIIKWYLIIIVTVIIITRSSIKQLSVLSITIRRIANSAALLIHLISASIGPPAGPIETYVELRRLRNRQ